MINQKNKLPKYESDAFDNVEYQLRITYTLETDRRIMSFIDRMWGIEISGGRDQYEPLTIINVEPYSLAQRAGMRVGDEITQINYSPALDLTFKEALDLFRSSKRFVRVYVRGDNDLPPEELDTRFYCDFWFKPRKPWRRDFKPIQWEFPWNDKRRPVYKESNCYMVPSRMEEVIRLRRAVTSVVKKKPMSSMPHTRSLTPSPRLPINSHNATNIFDGTSKSRKLRAPLY